MSLRKLVRKLGKVAGKGLELASPRLSIRGHKFALSPLDMPVRVAGSALRGGRVPQALDDSRKAQLRTTGVLAALYGGHALAGALGGAGTGGAVSAGTGGALSAARSAGVDPANLLASDPQNPANAVNAVTGGSDPSRFRSIGKWLGGNWDKIGDVGSAAETVYGNYRKAKLQDEYLRNLREDRVRRRPFQDKALEMLNAPDQETASVFADPYDPNGRYRRLSVGSRY